MEVAYSGGMCILGDKSVGEVIRKQGSVFEAANL